MGISKIVDKLKAHSVHDAPAADAAVSGDLLDSQLCRTRFHFGVNFGGCFVLEKWIFHSIFPEGTEVELEAVAKGAKDDKKDYKKRLEAHWSDYASEDDWKWLQSQGVTAVRIPVGYWHVGGGKFTLGTKYEPYADVYSEAWNIFKSKFVEAAAKHQIAVLVDLHGLPGGANGEAHSGELSGGQAGFWNSLSFQKLAADAVAFIAKDLKRYSNIAGIQIVNEAEFSDSALKQKLYYMRALEAIRKEDGSIPVVILDGWWPDQWAKWVQEHQKDGRNLGIVVDDHCYRCFDEKDRAKSVPQIIEDLDGSVLTNLNDGGRGVDFMVGEYSCVVDGKSWEKSDNGKRSELVEEYGAKQLRLFEQRAGAGLYFWTFKFEAQGGEWDFREMAGRAVRPPKVQEPLLDKLEELLKTNFDQHVHYWDERGGKYEHARYEAGFRAAWADGAAFARKGALVGRRQAVWAARRAEYVKKEGQLDWLWEWDQGWEKGMAEFVRAALA